MKFSFKRRRRGRKKRGRKCSKVTHLSFIRWTSRCIDVRNEKYASKINLEKDCTPVSQQICERKKCICLSDGLRKCACRGAEKVDVRFTLRPDDWIAGATGYFFLPCQ